MAEWKVQPVELDTTGVHGAVLPNGDVLYFSYDPSDENNVDRCKWQIWNEDTGPLAPAANILHRNLFCSGHCWLGDGRLLVAAGQSWNFVSQGIWGADHDIHTFDPIARSWTRHANMPAARYYPTCVTLADGNGFIVGGAWTRVPVNRVNHEAEMFDWRTNTLLARIPFNPGFIEELYPFLQLLPDGSAQGLLWVHSGERARLFSPATGVWLRPTFRTTSRGNRNYPKQGAAVLLPLLPSEGYKVRVLLVGGGTTTDDATGSAQIFDFNGAEPTTSAYRDPLGGHPNFRRFMSDAVLLADGSILICGGAGEGSADHSHDPVFDCEIFDPVTETFRGDVRINRQRMYHGAAVLLPSGRVALTGNTEHWNPANPVEDKSVEIYTPDYLLGGNRPTLLSAPGSVAYGDLVELETPDASQIQRVALVRSPTVTHSNNMDQRWVGLEIVGRLAALLKVRIPSERAVAPPGHYMFFLIDSQGVPSVARFTRLDPQLTSSNWALVYNTWITVREAESDIDTAIYVQPGDEFELEANGDIWAGVAFTGRNGPKGWNTVDHDPKFPLHVGSNAHPYSLIGRFAGRDWFYVGMHLGRVPYTDTTARRLFLRTNDDTPGNGNGQFHCLVRVWREQGSGPPPPPEKILEVSPEPMRIPTRGRQRVIIHALDKHTRNEVAGTVHIINPGDSEHIENTNNWFEFMFKKRRQSSTDPWEYPEVWVEAPGYPEAMVNISFQ